MLDEWQICFICASAKHEAEVTRCFFMRILVLLCVFALPLSGSAQQEPEGYILKSIYFGGGSFYIDDGQFFELKHLVESLLNLDFKSNQIEIRDFGQFNPIYDNSTWEGRSRNRRVDIIFWPVVM